MCCGSFTSTGALAESRYLQAAQNVLGVLDNLERMPSQQIVDCVRSQIHSVNASLESMLNRGYINQAGLCKQEKV
jgi:hypothetical protein